MTAEIRLTTTNDAAGIAEIYGPIVASTPISFEAVPPDALEMRRRIGATLPACPWLVYEHGGRVAGYAYASPHKPRAGYRWSVDTSVYIRSEFRRRGIGQGLYVSLLRILEAQGFYRAYAGIALPNPGSVGLHEAAGFKAIGVYRKVGYKLGAWHDVGWWGLDLQPSEAANVEPRPVLSVTQVQEDPAWRGMLASGLACIRETS